jgi:hypothetical protein
MFLSRTGQTINLAWSDAAREASAEARKTEAASVMETIKGIAEKVRRDKIKTKCAVEGDCWNSDDLYNKLKQDKSLQGSKIYRRGGFFKSDMNVNHSKLVGMPLPNGYIPHQWVEVDGSIVDIAADQFGKSFPKVWITKSREYHKED